MNDRDRPDSENARRRPANRGSPAPSIFDDNRRRTDRAPKPDGEAEGANRRTGEPDRRNHASRSAILDRFRAEFRDMPGLWVTRAEARRLFGVPEDICMRVLDQLVLEGMLIPTADGIYHTPSRISHQRG